MRASRAPMRGHLRPAGYGTALGVVRSAWHAGRLAHVYAAMVASRARTNTAG